MRILLPNPTWFLIILNNTIPLSGSNDGVKLGKKSTPHQVDSIFSFSGKLLQLGVASQDQISHHTIWIWFAFLENLILGWLMYLAKSLPQ